MYLKSFVFSEKKTTLCRYQYGGIAGYNYLVTTQRRDSRKIERSEGKKTLKAWVASINYFARLSLKRFDPRGRE